MGWSGAQKVDGKWRPGTAHVLHNAAERNRRQGLILAKDLPPPDWRLNDLIVDTTVDRALIKDLMAEHPRLRGDTPIWSDSTYQAWKRSRPGRGRPGQSRRK
jgi:hypothetical protein